MHLKEMHKETWKKLSRKRMDMARIPGNMPYLYVSYFASAMFPSQETSDFLWCILVAKYTS